MTDPIDEHRDVSARSGSEDLLSAIDVIEQQPLAERAAAYAALHDDLVRELERAPESR